MPTLTNIEITQQLKTLLRKHIDSRKRLKPSFYFKKNGELRELVKQACLSHPQSFYCLAPYRVCIDIGTDEDWQSIDNWLSENCRFAWLPLFGAIAFVEQSDAVLFCLFRESLVPKYPDNE